MIVQHRYRVDLGQPMTPRYLPEALFYSDEDSDQFVVELTNGLTPVDVSGHTVNGYFVRESTGETIILRDTGVSGNTANVVLDSACYAVEGRCMIVIQLSLGGEKKTVFLAHLKVVPTHTDTYVDPGTVVADITTLLETAQQLYNDLEATQDEFDELYAEILAAIVQANNTIAALADTSIHHYIQMEAPTESLRNGDLWTYKGVYSWTNFATDYPTWEDASETTWGAIFGAGSAGETKTYYNGVWLLMSSVDMASLPSSENNSF